MDISDVRRKFPQYEDIPDAALLAAVHRKFYSDIPQSEFMAKFKKSAPEPEAQTRTLAQDATRAAGLGVSDVVQGLAAIPNIVGDAANTAVNYGIRGINALGGNVPEFGLPSQALPRLLTSAGLPEPETGAEKFTSAVNKAVVGMGPLVKGAQMAGEGVKSAVPFVRSLVTNPVAEIVAAGAGAGASDITRQMGGGTAAQLIAGAVAPMGMTAAGEVARRGATAVNELRRPLTRGGAEQIAADVIGRTASKKDVALRNLAQHSALSKSGATVGVPGGAPTAAAVAGDYGLTQGQQLISRGAANPRFSERFAANNEARIRDLEKLRATDAMVEFYEKKRDDITATLRNATLSGRNVRGDVNVDAILDETFRTFRKEAAQGDDARRALDWIYGRLERAKAEGATSPADIYNGVHKDLNRLITKGVDSPDGRIRLAAGVATGIKTVIADEVEKVAPGFKNYLQHYSRLSRPIERLEVIRDKLGGDKLSKVTNALPQVTDSGASFSVSQNSMRKALEGIEKDTRLAPRQADILNRVLGDLNAETFAARGGKQPGSDTYQNMASANFMSRVFGDTLAQSGAAKVLQSPLNLINRPLESRISDIVTEAYLDPQLMERLLRKARTSRGSPDVSGLVGYGGAGLLGSVLAQ